MHALLDLQLIEHSAIFEGKPQGQTTIVFVNPGLEEMQEVVQQAKETGHRDSVRGASLWNTSSRFRVCLVCC